MLDAVDGGGGGMGTSIGQPMPNLDPHALGIDSSINNFASGAASGAISVDAQGGAALIQFAHSVQQWYGTHTFDLQNAAQLPQLGDSVAAKVVSPYMSKVGTDSNGYLQQMQKMAQTMDKFIDAVNVAMKNYQSNESANAAGFKKI